MRKNADWADSLSPTERMKRNFSKRRWSDSPTLLRNQTLESDSCLASVGHDLTQSLHDLTQPILHHVSKVSSASQNNLSTETLQFDNNGIAKSQDSGFYKSASSLSLNSTTRKYDHVESKVKKYVQGIKDAEALRKKSMSTGYVNKCVPPSPKEHKFPLELGDDVNVIINKMQSDLENKDALIQVLQGSYNDLLVKYAEAENKIDQLRIRSLHNSPCRNRRSQSALPDSFVFSPSFEFEKHREEFEREPHLPEASTPASGHQNQVANDGIGLDDTFSFTFSDSNAASPLPQSDQTKSEGTLPHQKEVIISAPLGPIQKLYSSSVRLDRVLSPLGPFSPVKSEMGKLITSASEIQESHQLPVVTERLVEKRTDSDLGKSKEFEPVKSHSLCYITADAGMSNNVYHMTTDTGIEDCDKDTGENEGRNTIGCLPAGTELKQIPLVPNEDAFSKVQRWRDSLSYDVKEPIIKGSTKFKKCRKKLALPGKTIGVQTSISENIPGLCSVGPSQSATLIKISSGDPSDNDYAESLEVTDCDNYSSELSHTCPRKLSGSPNSTYQRSRSVSQNRHLCCGECNTCGNAIVGKNSAILKLPPSCMSYLSPKTKAKEFPPRKYEKFRRDTQCPRKHARCSRTAGAQITRAVLLDMLLNIQSTHECCCCCQHMWRGRTSESPLPREEISQPVEPYEGENALQRCLSEIQQIAVELNAKLAASHAGLVNLSCRKKE